MLSPVTLPVAAGDLSPTRAAAPDAAGFAPLMATLLAPAAGGSALPVGGKAVPAAPPKLSSIADHSPPPVDGGLEEVAPTTATALALPDILPILAQAGTAPDAAATPAASGADVPAATSPSQPVTAPGPVAVALPDQPAVATVLGSAPVPAATLPELPTLTPVSSKEDTTAPHGRFPAKGASAPTDARPPKSVRAPTQSVSAGPAAVAPAVPVDDDALPITIADMPAEADAAGAGMVEVALPATSGGQPAPTPATPGRTATAPARRIAIATATPVTSPPPSAVASPDPEAAARGTDQPDAGEAPPVQETAPIAPATDDALAATIAATLMMSLPATPGAPSAAAPTPFAIVTPTLAGLSDAALTVAPALSGVSGSALSAPDPTAPPASPATAGTDPDGLPTTTQAPGQVATNAALPAVPVSASNPGTAWRVGAARPDAPALAEVSVAGQVASSGAPMPRRTAPVAAPVRSAPSDTAPVAQAGSPPVAPGVAPAAAPTPLATIGVSSLLATAPVHPAAPTAPAAAPPGPTGHVDAPRHETAAVQPRTPTPTTAANAPAKDRPVSALEAFGAAMRRSLGIADAPATPATPVTPVAAASVPAAIAAPDPAGATLDLADTRWPADMAAQIERLRDAADETSTSIRVSPDALGPVQIAVRREGEVTHVQLSATQPETRALLAAAQPQLLAAADARGLRLGRTGVDAGGAQAGGDPRPQQGRAGTPARPTRHAAPVRDDPTDTRLA